MATVHKISEGLFVDSFDLIALHSTMESYAIAYHINHAAGITLSRMEEDLEISTVSFPMYEFVDEINDVEWYLVSNSVQQEEDDDIGLFQNSQSLKTHYLLEDRKDINYLLKVRPEGAEETQRALSSLRSIPKISLAYRVDIATLKSRKNLIF